MRPHDDARHLDFIALSAHKMYAPYGTGALVGARAAFSDMPDQAGGGTVHAVTTAGVAWAGLPDREEAGSPNVLGAIALATAIRTLCGIGLDRIAAHERRLTHWAVRRLGEIEGVTIHGPAHDADGSGRLGVIPFTVAGIDHSLVAAALGYEHGVGVRNGCFCAHPYIAELLGLDRAETARWVDQAAGGDKRGAPGLVRISFGCYNDARDVEVAAAAIEQVVAGALAGDYRAERDGSFHPVGYVEPLLFTLRPA
jgi:selenocysteine lyase/cysteine desulfurase